MKVSDAGKTSGEGEGHELFTAFVLTVDSCTARDGYRNNIYLSPSEWPNRDQRISNNLAKVFDN